MKVFSSRSLSAVLVDARPPDLRFHHLARYSPPRGRAGNGKLDQFLGNILLPAIGALTLNHSHRAYPARCCESRKQFSTKVIKPLRRAGNNKTMVSVVLWYNSVRLASATLRTIRITPLCGWLKPGKPRGIQGRRYGTGLPVPPRLDQDSSGTPGCASSARSRSIHSRT